MVELALMLPLFLTFTLGVIDGGRAIFYYSQVQEAARSGARWGSVQVARANADNLSLPYGDFTDQGNAAGVYCAACTTYPLQSSRLLTVTNSVTPTIVGAALQAAQAVDLTKMSITISNTVVSTETAQTATGVTNQTVQVTVAYTFTPILNVLFLGRSFRLIGTSTMLHE